MLEQVRVELHGEVLCLRPTLACALRLFGKYEGPLDLAQKLEEGSLQAACDVIEAAGYPVDQYRRWRVIDVLGEVTLPLTHLVSDLVAPLAGTAEDGEGEADATWTVVYRDLFATATGFLGWTPSTAYEATVSEIVVATRARVKMLQALFGRGEEKPEKRPSLDEQFRTTFHLIGQRQGVRRVRRG